MWRADSNAPANRCNDSTVSVLRSASRRNSSMIAPVSAQDRTHRLPSATCSGVQLDSGFGSLIALKSRVLMREIQALDPTVDPDQAIRTLCAPAAPAVPKAPAALATPAAAQALKLTDGAASWRGPDAAFLQNATLPHTHTRGCTPGWYAVPRWGTQLNLRRPYAAPWRQPQ